MENCIFQRLKTGDKNSRQKLDLKTNHFNGGNFSNTIFVKCDLKKVDFAQSTLERTTFESCDLSETSFKEAQTQGISFSNCIIYHTQLDIDGFINVGLSKGFIISP
jgi:uncharacterized protein YjbI with pentapeptide repeats